MVCTDAEEGGSTASHCQRNGIKTSTRNLRKKKKLCTMSVLELYEIYVNGLYPLVDQNSTKMKTYVVRVCNDAVNLNNSKTSHLRIKKLNLPKTAIYKYKCAPFFIGNRTQTFSRFNLSN